MPAASRFASKTLLACVATFVALETRADDEAVRVSPPVDAVLDESARTGRPVLAVCGYDHCAACQRLRARLATDPVTAEFLRIDLTIAGVPEWRNWQAFADTKAWSSPQLYVVRADGTMLVSGRAQADMGDELRAALREAGVPLSEQEATLTAKLLEKARALAGAGDPTGALRELGPALAKTSFARAAVAARAFGTTLVADLERSIESVAATVGDDANGVATAVGLVAVVKDCGAAAPDLAKAAVGKLTALKRSPATAEVVRQAEQIHAATVAARSSASRGRAMLEKIVADRPDSGAAEVAKARLEKLETSDVQAPRSR